VGPSTPIEVQFRTGATGEERWPGDYRWSHTGLNGDIIAYRVLHNHSFGKFGAAVGDVYSTAKGSGARYNAAKPPYELIPLSIIVPFYSKPFADAAPSEQAIARALNALDALGMFQAREGDVYDVLRELGDNWDGCAAVFEMTPEFANWNWTKGTPWSIPIARAARHLMAIIRGEVTNTQSGLSNVAHVYCNVVILATYQSTFIEGDDRPVRGMLL
jgi:hypothetical protein